MHAPSGSCLHHQLAIALAEDGAEFILVIPDDDVVEPWLATELVYPLSDFVSCSISETGEEGEEAFV